MRTVIVFGAAGSIGQAICTHFKAQDYLHVGVGRAESAEHSTVKWDGDAKAFSDSMRSLLDGAKISAVVWAQGMNFNDDIDTFDLSQHLKMYEANVTYILSTLKALIDFDLLQDDARLCVISSIWQNIARQKKLSYCITKSALQGLVQSLSIDLGKQGKLINAVLPGALDTVMTRANLSQEQVTRLESITPLGSLPNLTDVTGLVVYLCSPQNTGITGQFIAADRGLAMLESFDVSTSGGKYKVTVGEGLLDLIKSNQHTIFLVDEYLAPRLAFDPKLIIAIPALESSKNLDYMSGVIEKIRTLGANRDTHVYAIGGGIIQDIATFVNSIYMRGLSWTYFPSTLLSMADSCIGGKSSINVRGYKNLVGNIYPPNAVFVDMDFCQTLGPKEIIGGLAEAVKICYARGADVFEKYLELDPLYPLAGEKGVKVVFSALLAKKWFIEIDEFDQSERLLLNYGHTFGHALEASSNFELAHGVAVALGMLVATQFANLSGLLTEAGMKQAKKLDAYLIKLLAPLHGDIRNILAKMDLKLVLAKFEGDKKHRHEEYRVVIPVANGGLILHSCPKNENSKIMIEQAFKKTFVLHGFLDS